MYKEGATPEKTDVQGYTEYEAEAAKKVGISVRREWIDDGKMKGKED